MKRLLFLSLLYVLPANANIVPSFTTGNMQSTTSTVTTISETITSKDYKTGYEYTVTGTGIKYSGGNMAPAAVETTGTVGGVSYTWTGADMTTKPTWELVNPTSGNAFQFQESYSGPSLQNVTTITRDITTESVTSTTSVFSQ